MPPCKLDTEGKRTSAQRTADAHDAVLDRQPVVKLKRDADRPHDLTLDEGPPRHTLHDRLTAELERVAEFTAADASVECYTVSASVTLKDGSSFVIGLPVAV